MYDTAESRYRCCRSPIIRIKEDARDYNPCEVSEPSHIYAPSVDLRTDETATFLPHNNQGEREEVTRPTSVECQLPQHAPPPIRPQTRSSPSPELPVPTPITASYPERAIMHSINAPPHIVPSGRYNGTQPAIVPSAQAGNCTIYRTCPISKVEPALHVSPEPPQEPYAAPRTCSGSKDTSTAYVPGLGDSRHHLPSRLDDGTRVTNCNSQPSECETRQHRNRTCVIVCFTTRCLALKTIMQVFVRFICLGATPTPALEARKWSELR